jgi:hypothetical protein
MAKFKIESNQYTPRKSSWASPNGFSRGETYYYLTNEQGKVVDKKTLKTYRGKQMNRYAFYSLQDIEKFLKQIEGE